MNSILAEMISIFQPGDTDWMGNIVSRKNPFTYHHIYERRNGGDKSVDNGAILTRTSHDLLNYFECHAPKYYHALNKCFIALNNTKKPPTDDYYQTVDFLITSALEELARKEEKSYKHSKPKYVRQRRR